MSTVLRYTLNGTILTDEPLGWLDTSETIRREETFFSLVNEVQGQMEFVKQGLLSTQSFNIITTAITANPFQKLTFLIERQNSSGIFEEEFDGIIPLTGTILDEINGFYSASVIINDVGKTIRDNLEAPYYFLLTQSLDGSSSIADAFSSKKTTTLQDPESTLADQTNIPTYPIAVVLQSQLDYITNTEITLASDLFETDTQQKRITDITFTGITDGEVITIVFDFFSGTYTFTHTYVNATFSNFVIELLDFLKVKSAGAVNQRRYTENKNGDINYLNVWQNNVSIPNPIIRFTSVNDFTITNVSGDIGLTAVISSSQSPTYGMKNLSFATGNNLAEAGGVDSIPPSISLQNILENLNKQLHISFRIIKTAGVQTFKIERFEDFFESNTSITVNRVTNLTKELIDDFNIATSTPGDAHTAEFGDEVHEVASYKSTNVTNRELDLTSTFITDGQTAYDNAEGVSSSNNGLEDFYFLIVEDNTASPNIVERILYNDLTFSASETFTYKPYNTFLTNFQRLRGNFFRLSNNIGNGDIRADANANTRAILIPNTKARDFLYRTTFEGPISFANWTSIKNGQTEKILYNTDGLTNSEGWLFEADYNKKTGLVKFILLTE